MFALSGLLFSGGNQGRAIPQSNAGGLDWPAYGRDAGGSRYSPLSQINRDNVKRLKASWTYRTGHVAEGNRAAETIQFETTPIMVDGTLYLSTPFNRVMALNPQTGTERWTFDPKLDL